MGLVLYALKYRVTFFVLAIVMMLGGIGAGVVTKEGRPAGRQHPVVVIVWTYVGLDTTDMASRIATYSEFSLSDNVDNIRRMESETLQGYTIEKLYFQPNVSIDLAIAQVVSCTNSIRAVMPTGVQPPIVLRFSASSQPIIQLALSSATTSGADLYDYALYRIRQTLQTTPGATIADALRRRAAPDPGRPRPARAPGARHDPDRRHQRRRQPERRRAVGPREVRLDPIPDPARTPRPTPIRT